MKQPEAGRIARVIADQTIGGRDEILFAEVSDSRVPACVKSYLHSEVSAAVSSGLASSAHGKKIGDAAGVLIGAAAFGYRFSRTEYLAALDCAVAVLGEYLVNPRLQLERSLFGTKESVSQTEAERALAGFSDYSYLPSLIRRMVRNAPHVDVRREWFREVAGRLDDEVVSRHSGKELVRLTEPIFAFFLHGSEETPGTIPSHLLRDFFSEKNLHGFWQKIESSLNNRESVSYAELLRIVEGGNEDQKVMQEAHAGEPANTEKRTTRMEEEGKSVRMQVSEGEPVDQRAAEHHAQAEQEESVIPALSTLISSEEERRFVRHLFKNDTAYYREVIASLNKMESWKEAALYLSEFYQTNGLDPFTDDVVLFTDAVYQRYDRNLER